MRLVLIGVLVLVLATSVWTGVTVAQDGGEPDQVWAEAAEGADLIAQAPVGPGVPRVQGLRQRLNLTDAQARRVEQITAAHTEKTARLRIALARARLDARELLLETTPDRAKLDAVPRRIGDLYGQLVRARLDYMFELRGVLTAEQWGQLRAMMARRAAARRDRDR